MAFTLDSHLLVGIAGLLLGLLIALLFGGGRAKRRYEVYEAKIGQHRAETEARDAERASLEREVASLRDQVRPLSDEVDRLRRQIESRRAAPAVAPPSAPVGTMSVMPSVTTVDTAGPVVAGGAIAPSFTPAEAHPVGSRPADHGPLPAFLDAPRGQPDDLRLLKGVGDRFAAKLNEIGVFHFRQIANWSPEEEAAADARLDAFRGRIGRDRLVEQATLLAAGRTTEYEARFGKLGAPDA